MNKSKEAAVMETGVFAESFINPFNTEDEILE
jgi:hypothetical protein